MNIRNLSLETNDLVRELVNIGRKLNPVSELELAKNGLIDSSTLFAGTIEGLNYETNNTVVIAKINQATDASGRTIFWINYLIKETAMDSITGERLLNNIGKITNELITYRIDIEKSISPSFQGEWLLED